MKGKWATLQKFGNESKGERKYGSLVYKYTETNKNKVNALAHVKLLYNYNCIALKFSR